MNAPYSNPTQMLRIKQVVERTGLSKSSIYDLLNPSSKRFCEQFPRPVKLTASAAKTAAVGWYEADVSAYLLSKKLMH